MSSTGQLNLLSATNTVEMLRSQWDARSSGHRVFVGTAAERVENLRFLKELVESGHYRPMIDRCYPLERIVDAHAYVESRRKRGSVVIWMA